MDATVEKRRDVVGYTEQKQDPQDGSWASLAFLMPMPYASQHSTIKQHLSLDLRNFSLDEHALESLKEQSSSLLSGGALWSQLQRIVYIDRQSVKLSQRANDSDEELLDDFVDIVREIIERHFFEQDRERTASRLFSIYDVAKHFVLNDSERVNDIDDGKERLQYDDEEKATTVVMAKDDLLRDILAKMPNVYRSNSGERKYYAVRDSSALQRIATRQWMKMYENRARQVIERYSSMMEERIATNQQTLVLAKLYHFEYDMHELAAEKTALLCKAISVPRPDKVEIVDRSELRASDNVVEVMLNGSPVTIDTRPLLGGSVQVQTVCVDDSDSEGSAAVSLTCYGAAQDIVEFVCRLGHQVFVLQSDGKRTTYLCSRVPFVFK